jgi:hypothetical protein
VTEHPGTTNVKHPKINARKVAARILKENLSVTVLLPELKKPVIIVVIGIKYLWPFFAHRLVQCNSNETTGTERSGETMELAAP